jgi:hypothetical protein
MAPSTACELTFFSIQERPSGPKVRTATEWDLTYTTELIDGLWYITGPPTRLGATQCVGD